jgi:hypothetical protein
LPFQDFLVELSYAFITESHLRNAAIAPVAATHSAVLDAPAVSG